MATSFTTCRSCGARMHETEARCFACGAEPGGAVTETRTVRVRAGRGPLWWFPTGLVVALALWLGGSYAYLRWERTTTPEYQAALLVHEAEGLLGADDGKTATKESLARALALYVKALKLLPGDRQLHGRVDTIKFRHVERKLKVDPEVDRDLAFLSAWQLKEEQAKQGFFEGTLRERWDIEALERVPGKALRTSAFGSVLIVALYGWWRWQQSSREELRKLDPNDHRPLSGRR